MVRSHAAFAGADRLAGSGDDVLGDAVMTDEGTALGTVIDVIASVRAGEADIVGFELSAREALGTDGEHVLIPLPTALAISGEAIVVPASVHAYASKDTIDLDVSVEAFRRQLEEA
jgi:uncharacterized protein YrrD